MPDSTSSWLHDIVSSLVHSAAPAHAGPNCPPLDPPYNDITRFVLQQQARLPDYLRSPIKLATLGFDLLGCLRTGRLFHSRSAPIRACQIAAWKNSNWGFQRDFIRYYESLATFALYSRQQSNIATQPLPAVLEEIKSAQVLSHPEPALHCEIAVVESDPGGAITACLLAEAGRDVLVIEEGPFHSLESCAPFSLEEMVQKYRNGGQTVALGKNKIAYVEGRCVGGGSEINSGLYHRTPPDVLESWRDRFQVEALTDQDLDPHFVACEQELSVSLLPDSPPAASLKLQAGAMRLGWNCLEVPRWFRYSGPNNDRGARQSMTRSFIPRFLKAGGRLLPGTRVGKIARAGEKWSLQV